MNKLRFLHLLCGIAVFLFYSCTDVNITMPKGPKGDTGLSAYEFWKEKVADGTIEWPKDQVGVADYFKYIKGKDGTDGEDGQSAFDQWKEMIAAGSVDDPHNPGGKWSAANNTVQDFWKFLTGATGESGQTPHIGSNGNWFIGSNDTGIEARGKDGTNGTNGKDAVPPTVTIGNNDNWFVDGVDTGKSAKGTDGKDAVSPAVTIGNNNNWFVNGVDTGKKAVGTDGKSPEVAIGNNGNWFINGLDTKKPSFGKDGKDGAGGKSAYELWKEYIASGDVDDPHNSDVKWPASRNKQIDFWEFLTGKSTVITIEKGKYNVISQFWNADLREYVSSQDGSVIFTVYNTIGDLVPAGVQVKGLPGISASEIFTTDEYGQFKVTWDKLPDLKELIDRKGSVDVIVNGTTEKSATNTQVPNRVNVKGIVNRVYLIIPYSDIDAPPCTEIYLKLQRQVDGEWSDYPNTLPLPYVYNTAKIIDINKPVDKTNLNKSIFNICRAYGAQDLFVARPVVLTPKEKTNISKNDTIARLQPYEWNKEENYVGVYLGDGNGTSNDYGQTIYFADKIHLPEVYPAPGLKTGSVYIEVKQGVTTLWGEIDTDQLYDFYKTYYSYALTGYYKKEESTGIWKLPSGKLSATNLESDRAVFITMSTYVNGTGGTAHTGTTELSKGGKRFKLASAYPNNWIGIDVRQRRQNSNVINFYVSGEYRGRYAYYLHRDSQTNEYYLVDFADRITRIPLEQKDCPADWMQ